MTSKEIEELAGHRPVSAWVFKLVADAIAIEREECAKVCDAYGMPDGTSETAKMLAYVIRSRGNNDV